MARPENREELNLLRVDADREGEQVQVQTKDAVPMNAGLIDANVDEDGTVRQESNGAAFNPDAYEVVE